MAQVSFKASLNKTQIGKSERFQLTFTVNAEGSNFEPPALNDFKLLSGPNRSTSMRIVNFERSVENSYSYILMPQKAGVFKIGSASIKVAGETYYSEPIALKVSEQNPGSSNPNSPYSKAEREAFFRVLTSKSTVYQGEPILASYKLYFSTEVSRPEVINEPDFTGFYKTPLEIKRINTSNESYKGSIYTTGVIRQVLLIPQQTGKIEAGTVDFRIPTNIPTNRRDVFGRRMMQTVVQSASEKFPAIRVLPLPTKGQPSSFAGAVGKYELAVNVSRNELSADESLTLKVSISGTGNLKLVDAPKPEIPKAFEAFDPKYSEKVVVNGRGMSGSKTYEYLLIPRYGGTYKIPEVQFSYFDPDRKQYRTLKSEPISVTVTGGAAMPETNADGTPAQGKEVVGFINEEILFIKTDASQLTKNPEPFFGSTRFYGLLLGSLLIWLSAIGAFVYIRQFRADQHLLRSKQAGKKARKHLSKAKTALAASNTDEFYEALTVALWGYFSDKFHIPGSKLSKDGILEQLRDEGLDNGLIDKIESILNRAEMARYTNLKQGQPEADYELATKLLTQVENSL